jgi:hypothetical protein
MNAWHSLGLSTVHNSPQTITEQIQSFGFTEVKNTILLSHTKLFG